MGNHEIDISLREYIEAVLREHKAALTVASDEREKAASALREQLTLRIESGDNNLREHITAQVEQIKSALISAGLLEEARVSEVASAAEANRKTNAERINAVQREVTLVHQASEAAILKAETATEKRFASVNEFRDQLREQSQTFSTHAEVQATAIEFRRNFETNQGRIAALEQDQAARGQMGAVVTNNVERVARIESFQSKMMGAVAAVGFIATMLGIVSLVVTLSH